jgi:hypothetical protein
MYEEVTVAGGCWLLLVVVGCCWWLLVLPAMLISPNGMYEE